MRKTDLVLKKTYDCTRDDDDRLTVVMIHGIASASYTYDKALEYFRDTQKFQKIRFVTFDLLGSGRSLSSDELNYDYDEQIAALHNAIHQLNAKSPIVLVGHSLGTFIVTRYTSTYPDDINQLILVSPPIYTPEDFKNPAFAIGIEMFKKSVSVKNPHILQERPFNNSMENIVLDINNYSYLTKLKTKTTLIYGNEDAIIASYNIPELLKKNSNLSAIKTIGRHGVTYDKFTKIGKILEESLNAKTI